MGKGGCRPGAGRPGWKVKAETCIKLEIKRWHRDGVLSPGRCGTWTWTDGDGDRVGSIGYQVHGESVFLEYTVGGRPASQWIMLDRTACHYGGSRRWFRCPVCDRRVGVLYMRCVRFACRLCQQVAYRSQSEDACGRAWLRQAKIEAKLGENWKRPKGMRRATHERLVAELLNCELQREDALAAFIARMC